MNKQSIVGRPVISAFKCLVKDQHFSVGDAYASDDAERIAFLEEKGFLGAEVKPVSDDQDVSADELLAQSADKIVKALSAEEKEAAALQILLGKEKSGKNRKTVVETLEAMLAKLQSPPKEE